jgi:glycosyltransferase involved in cell wall biosynthesis
MAGAAHEREQEQDTSSHRGKVEHASTPLASVIIASYNGADTIAAQIAALGAEFASGGCEVIVADNGSTDQTTTVARSADPDVRVIDAAAPRGVAYARNKGAEAAQGQLLLFLDQDDVVEPGYVAAMLEAGQNSVLIAASMDDRALNPGWVGKSRSVEQRDGVRDAGFPWAYGGTLGVDAKTFRELGGFSEGMTASEDMEFCWRAYEKGHQLTFVPEAVLRYRFPATLGALYRQGRKYALAGEDLHARHPAMPFTHPPRTQLVKQLLRATLDVVIGWTNGLHGRGAFNLGRNLVWFLHSFRSTRHAS